MEPTSPELDTIADLLHRWQGVDGPMERVRLVSDAADALRGLSTLDARTLAQGLWEHGAGPAAQQVADRTGTSVAPEELAEVASAVLSLDRAEVDRLATELRDPEERRRLLVQSGVAAEQASRHVASPPPHGQPRVDVPPPPGAATDGLTSPETGAETPLSAPTEPDGPPAATEVGTPPAPAEPDGPPAVTEARTPPQPNPSVTPASRQERPDPAEIEPQAPTPRQVTPARAGSPDAWKPGRGLAERLHGAPNGRERFRLLDEEDNVVHGPAILGILDAVPDGWQRRTSLRKLVTADRVRDVPAADVVARFARDGDRFAVAALLVRTGTSELDAVLPALGPSDANRLLRRANDPRGDRPSHSRSG